MKKTISFMLALVCVIFGSLSITVHAAEITPKWDNTKTVELDLYFNTTIGQIDVAIMGDQDVSNITATVKLYYKNIFGIWVEMDQTWSYNVNQVYLSVNETFEAKSGRKYKVELTGYVTKNGYAEPISATTTQTCP